MRKKVEKILSELEDKKSKAINEWQYSKVNTNNHISKGGEAHGLDICISKLKEILK